MFFEGNSSYNFFFALRQEHSGRELQLQLRLRAASDDKKYTANKIRNKLLLVNCVARLERRSFLACDWLRAISAMH